MLKIKHKYKEIHLLKSLLLLLITISSANASEIKENNSIKNSTDSGKIKERSIEYMYGRFYNGPYLPYEIRNKKFNSCNAFNLCKMDKRLYGSSFGIRLIDEVKRKGNHKLDIDKIFSFNIQSPKLTEENKIKSIKGGSPRAFGMISYVPTYRYNFNKLSNRFSFGLGAGLNLAIGQVPSELPDKDPLNSQVNMEIEYHLPTKPKKSSIVFSLQHRCNLFGLIGGELKGRQWYTIGFRQMI